MSRLQQSSLQSTQGQNELLMSSVWERFLNVMDQRGADILAPFAHVCGSTVWSQSQYTAPGRSGLRGKWKRECKVQEATIPRLTNLPSL
uniref:Uncharacterized protein n=1 Tax=Anguilla anguilla TaxID=7936 RepID=A0A0E9X0E2_ANGAN